MSLPDQEPPEKPRFKNIEEAQRRVEDLESWLGSILVDRGQIRKQVYFVLFLGSLPVAGKIFQLAARRALHSYESHHMPTNAKEDVNR